MSKRTDDYWVTVCNHCLRASCWHGELYCEQAKHAGTIEMKASELDVLTPSLQGDPAENSSNVSHIRGQNCLIKITLTGDFLGSFRFCETAQAAPGLQR